MSFFLFCLQFFFNFMTIFMSLRPTYRTTRYKFMLLFTTHLFTSAGQLLNLSSAVQLPNRTVQFSNFGNCLQNIRGVYPKRPWNMVVISTNNLAGLYTQSVCDNNLWIFLNLFSQIFTREGTLTIATFNFGAYLGF